MSLPYPVAPNSEDSGSPYLPNLPATGYSSQNGPYPSGPVPGYPQGPNLIDSTPGYPPTSTNSPYPSSGPGYPPNPGPAGYPSNPVPAGYPSNPRPGGYPSNPGPGGYPSNPSPGGYPANPSPYPSTPASGIYPTIQNPEAYPSNPSPGGGYPPTPNSGGGYPSTPTFSGGNPSNSGFPAYPPSSSGYPAQPSSPYPPNPSQGISGSGPVYPPSPSEYSPSAPPMSYPSNPNSPSHASPFNPENRSSEAPFKPSAYPGVNNSSKPPNQQFKVGGISFPLDPMSNSATARIAQQLNKTVASSGMKEVQNAAKKILNPIISSGLDNLPLNRGLRDKIQQSSTDSKSSDMRCFKKQNFKELNCNLIKSRKLFEDPEFPASNSLLIDRCNGQDYVVSYFGRSKCDMNSIQWLRPHDICKGSGKSPKMFVGATNRFDINQGELGNCWFLAALSNLVEDKRYLAQVIPTDQSFESPYSGIFRFRFWRFGNWVEVVVDDRLPTRQGKLIYLRSVDSNEFWGALLEKAYAKLYGSYKALEGGLTIEAAVDFTGGIPELISLDSLSMSRERLFYLMSAAEANGAFMGAAMTRRSGYAQEARSKGLQSQHAYTITKVVEIRSGKFSGGIPLIRIRNPHGNSKEWRGDWADGDKHWKVIPKELRGKLGLTFEDDGEFYMSFSDFCIYFGDLEICHLTPDAAVTNFDPQGSSSKKFELFKFSGAWSNAKNTSGGCGNAGQKAFSQNPQFFLDLKDPDPYDDELQCSIVISLLQKNLDRSKENIAIGFKVYKCNAGMTSLNESFLKQNLAVERVETFMNLRETSKRMFLPEGHYCVIPCPFRQGDEAEFLLRVFVQKSWGSSEQSDGQTVKGIADTKKMHKFTDDLDNRLNIHGHRYGGDPKKKAKSVAGKALNMLEKRFPEGTKGIKKLKEIYSWAKDKDAEFDLLKKIIKSF